MMPVLGSRSPPSGFQKHGPDPLRETIRREDSVEAPKLLRDCAAKYIGKRSICSSSKQQAA